MKPMTPEHCWGAAIEEELRGLRRDVQEVVAILRELWSQDADGDKRSAGAPVGPPLLTVGDVANLLRTSPKAVYELIGRGRMAGVVRLGRKILVRRDVLTRALARGDLYSAALTK